MDILRRHRADTLDSEGGFATVDGELRERGTALVFLLVDHVRSCLHTEDDGSFPSTR